MVQGETPQSQEQETIYRSITMPERDILKGRLERIIPLGISDTQDFLCLALLNNLAGQTLDAPRLMAAWDLVRYGATRVSGFNDPDMDAFSRTEAKLEDILDAFTGDDSFVVEFMQYKEQVNAERLAEQQREEAVRQQRIARLHEALQHGFPDYELMQTHNAAGEVCAQLENEGGLATNTIYELYLHRERINILSLLGHGDPSRMLPVLKELNAQLIEVDTLIDRKLKEAHDNA